MRKYDEYGRPIKDNSFFDKFSKPKKREYSYKKEEKVDVDTLDRSMLEDSDDELIEDLDDEIISQNEEKREKEFEQNKIIDLSNFPVILIYVLSVFFGYLMIVALVLLTIKTKDGSVRGGEHLKIHLIIGIVIYILITLFWSFLRFI